jgi:hypothetical protein
LVDGSSAGVTVPGVDRLTVKLGRRENRLTSRQQTVRGMSANVRQSAANRPDVRSARTPKKLESAAAGDVARAPRALDFPIRFPINPR